MPDNNQMPTQKVLPQFANRGFKVFLGLYIVAFTIVLFIALIHLWPPKKCEIVNTPQAPLANLVDKGVSKPGTPAQGSNLDKVADNSQPEPPAEKSNEANPLTNANAGDTSNEIPASEAKTDESKTKPEKINSSTLKPEMDFEVRLLLLVLVLGALGSLVHAATSLVDYIGNNQLSPSWIWWYLLRPFIGSTLALIIYLLARSGLLLLQTNGGDPNNLNHLGFLGLAALSGMFSKQAIDKCREVLDVIFKNSQGETRQDKLSQGVSADTTSPQTPDQNASAVKKDGKDVAGS